MNESAIGNRQSEIPQRRPTWAEIDLDALASNVKFVRSRVGSDVQLMAVVKANAYGHGAVECSRRLAGEHVDCFGVALPEEGIELRRSGITEPIVCLAGFFSGQETLCLRELLTPVIYRIDMIESFDRASQSVGVVGDVFVKIDTGMGRLGVRFEDLGEFLDALSAFSHIRVLGLMTHFASADVPELDDFTHEQLTRFNQAATMFRERGHNLLFETTANSAATLTLPPARRNLVRMGGVMYGLWRDILPPNAEASELKPVMSLRSKIILLKTVACGERVGYGCTFTAQRDSLIATLPIGYHDGYPRAMSNRGRVIVRGQIAPVVGRVSMDLTLIDVTDVDGILLGDIVTLIGTDGKLEITAEDIAQLANTLSYEITCGISSRVPRIHRGTDFNL
jgi:alanine racemase